MSIHDMQVKRYSQIGIDRLISIFLKLGDKDKLIDFISGIRDKLKSQFDNNCIDVEVEEIDMFMLFMESLTVEIQNED